MAFVEWKEGFETGFAAYDAQHQTLFRLANRLHACLARPESEANQEIATALVAFLEMTRAHVRTEDELMRWQGYAPADDHDQAHGNFLRLLEATQTAEDARPLVATALQKFKAHFESDEEQAFLAILRKTRFPPTAS
jgi:hemerythrin-like metal-binding protein